QHDNPSPTGRYPLLNAGCKEERGGPAAPVLGPDSRHCPSLSRAGRGKVTASAQAALCFCCLQKSSARFFSSCGATSSLCVAIIQLLPDGSFTPPQRSP